MSDVTQIRVGRDKVGVVGLDEVFQRVQSEGLSGEAAVSERLLALTAERNYIAPSKRADYARALVRAYRRFLGEPVPAEVGGVLEIRVLGPGCPNCERLTNLVRDVLQARSIDADLEHVRDVKEIARYGPLATPALVVNGRVVASGRVPEKNRVIQWIEEARG